MKRSAFTLVELIFTIVIIGVLAAVAIPQYKNLQQNAEVKNVLKTTVDGASSAANAAVNRMDLEDNLSTDFNLDDLVSIKGKGWTYTEPTTNNGTGTYTYKFKNTVVATIDLNATGRSVIYKIDCAGFNSDPISRDKCYTATETNSSNPLNITLTF